RWARTRSCSPARVATPSPSSCRLPAIVRAGRYREVPFHASHFRARVSRRDGGYHLLAADVRAVRAQRPRIRIVQHIIQNAIERGAVFLCAYRRDHLHTLGQVARPPVGRPDEILGLAGVVEAVDARMLEKPAQLADDADVLRHALDAGPQAADLADHHVDLHTLV